MALRVVLRGLRPGIARAPARTLGPGRCQPATSRLAIPRAESRKCATHGTRVPHYLLENTLVTEASRLRAAYTHAERDLIAATCGSRDAYTGGATGLQIDHRVPQIRWVGDEARVDLSDPEAIRGEFQLLGADTNLIKSRACESCVRTGTRPAFFGLPVYFRGTDQFDPVLGCDGCPWAYPEGARQYVIECVQLTEQAL